VASKFHVVIQRPREGGADAVVRLAAAISERYGIPAAQLRDRLTAGRLRVKSNVDRETAETFAADLDALGAVCAILDAATDRPVARPAAAPSAASTAVPKAAAPVASGLAAAYSPAAEPELGALGGGDLSLATLDGADDVSPAPSFEPPPDAAALPASFGPASPPVPLAESPVHDRFAPPDAADEKLLDLDVAPTEPRRSGRLADAPPPPAAAPRAAVAAPASTIHRATSLATLAADPRARLAAGVLLAILVGFVPAHLVASAREASAFDRIDRDVRLRYAAVTSDADYAALDAMLARERQHKQDDRRNIALGSMLIWALTGGAIAFVWFRKLDWDAIAARLDRA